MQTPGCRDGTYKVLYDALEAGEDAEEVVIQQPPDLADDSDLSDVSSSASPQEAPSNERMKLQRYLDRYAPSDPVLQMMDYEHAKALGEARGKIRQARPQCKAATRRAGQCR